jgi:chorismate mutase
MSEGDPNMHNVPTLPELRERINLADEGILAALVERFQITELVGQRKAMDGLPARDPIREQERIETMSQRAEELGLNPELVANLYRLIMDNVVEHHEEIASEHNPSQD